MQLLLMRHGEAGYDAPSDELRHLSEQGRQRVQQMLNQHESLLDGVSRIVHSPYLRTLQTAQLVQQVHSLECETLALLTPESSPQQLLDWLSQQTDEKLMLVTHQPLIGQLVSLLCEGHVLHPEPMLPGALAVIELEFPAAGLGQLQQLVR
ncbi:phosphohistidine phosphatase SixA [Amphritea sp. 1_MG-2023]|uniref:phosphohistidine phosphatase SixA n=1 Tax=Amphritea sp. 1_MG-2023 TaxID=3062670 RepID=UPI0026E1E9B8|nr:phosphohistidine phosphatase SixA [Amphritea sp. 1_MG-2023]MDO6563460.1 phosphohistidine phosphatase SixA [Amphritea sp. 1_MG-2023]